MFTHSVSQIYSQFLDAKLSSHFSWVLGYYPNKSEIQSQSLSMILSLILTVTSVWNTIETGDICTDDDCNCYKIVLLFIPGLPGIRWKVVVIAKVSRWWRRSTATPSTSQTGSSRVGCSSGVQPGAQQTKNRKNLAKKIKQFTTNIYVRKGPEVGIGMLDFVEDIL